ncbi:MAG: hypothetical protein LBK67_11785 [Coriobacteriales bacterium]|jgi:hypothetical protein|nr:hypothetical protein [Coriobacteriales bacterium]
MAKYVIQPLSDFLKPDTNQELLDQKLGEFCCARDIQLKKFIHTQAVNYEKKGFSRTYLVFDLTAEQQLSIPPIAAFFTLAITATDYSEISKSKKAKVLGSKPGRETFKAFGGILIGQLARDDRYDSSFINGAELLDECERYIEYGRQFLGGRIVYLDCRAALVKTYQNSDYKLLTDTPSTEGYYKMYKVLPDKYTV